MFKVSARVLASHFPASARILLICKSGDVGGEEPRPRMPPFRGLVAWQQPYREGEGEWAESRSVSQ